MRTKPHAFPPGSIFLLLPTPHPPQPLPLSHPTAAGFVIKQTCSCIHRLSWEQGTEPGTWLELKPKPPNMHRSNHHSRFAAVFYRTGVVCVLCQPEQLSRSHAHACDLWKWDSIRPKHRFVARNGPGQKGEDLPNFPVCRMMCLEANPKEGFASCPQQVC